MNNSIRLLVMAAGEQTNESMAREISLFNKTHPSIQVEIETIQWSHAWARIVQSIKKKSGPDIIQIGSSWINPLMHLQGFKDLSKQDLEHLKEFPEFSEKNGSIHYLPWFTEIQTLYYNKNILNEYNIRPEDFNTWSGFKETCTRLIRESKNKITPFEFLPENAELLAQDLAPWIWNNGGDFFSKEKNRYVLDSPETIEGIQFYFDLISQMPTRGKYYTYSNLINDFFEYDRIAFLFLSSWPLFGYFSSKGYDIYPETQEKIGFSLLPEGPAGQNSFSGGSYLAIMNYTNQPDDSLKFYNFLTSSKSQLRHSTSLSSFPGNSSACRQAVTGIHPDYRKLTDQLYKNGKRPHFCSSWRLLEKMFGQSIAEMINSINAQTYSEDMLKQEMSDINQDLQFIQNF